MNSPAYSTKSRTTRRAKDRTFMVVCVCAAMLSILILATLLASIAINGAGRFGWDFITSNNSATDPQEAGIWNAMLGSVWMLAICALTAIPLGVGTAVLLEEYQPGHPILKKLHGFVQLNITNLAGVPSIVYGILGFSALATMFGLFGTIREPVYTIGQKWYHEYADAEGNYFYVKVGDRDAEARPPSADMTFRVAPEPGAPVAENVRIGEGAGAVQAELDAVGEALDEQINGARETVRSPAQIDRAKAEAMADAVLAGHELEADKAALKAGIVERLLPLDGMSGYKLGRERRAIVSWIEEQEFASRDLTGLLPADQTPQARYHRSWYYLQLPFGKSVLAGGLTLMLVVLPIIIVASQEAIRSVPQSMRHGSLALGGTKWQAIAKVVLPAAIPGVCTGTILGMSRAIGEAAPILTLGAGFVSFVPSNLMDGFSAMPLQIYQWAGDNRAGYQSTAAAGIIMLLIVLLSFNALAVFIRMKFAKPLS